MGLPSEPRQRRQIADALFTLTQQRVLAVLFGAPDRAFYGLQIIERSGVGRGTVQRELARLVASGLVLVEPMGNQKHYRANPAAPIFAELVSIIRKTSGLADPVREALEPLSDRIELALIYGSVARGEATAASDVDLLVVADEVSLEELLTALAPAERALGRRIAPTLYSSAEFATRRAGGHHFVTGVLAGATIPLIGDESP